MMQWKTATIMSKQGWKKIVLLKQAGDFPLLI
jgi:hypothetical protein